MKTIRKRITILLSVALFVSNSAGPGTAEEKNGLARDGDVWSKKLYRCKPGPWGDLEYYYTFLEAPENVRRIWPDPPIQTEWHFVGYPAVQVRAFFATAGFPQNLREMLADESLWSVKGEVTSVRPPLEVITGMTPEMRGAVYRALRQWGLNAYHSDPAYIDNGKVSDWYAHSGIPPEIVAEIEGLTYAEGRSLVFCDIPFVLRKITDPLVRRDLAAKMVTRTRSLILRMRLSEQSDLEKIEEYWTRGYAQKDALPLLRSVVATEGIGRLDIAHLLPPMPRKLLYMYPPLEWVKASGRHFDCFWTCDMFFEATPSARESDPRSPAERLHASLEPVSPPYRFGDVLIAKKGVKFGEVSGTPLHSCVFIADEIVYTKNGQGVSQPWALMTIEDMLGRYGKIGIGLEAFRFR